MRNTGFIIVVFLLILLSSCAKKALDIDVGRIKVINATDLPYAVFVRPAADSIALERYVGTLPRASYIIVPLRANETYELKIGEINTGRLDKFEEIFTLQKDESIALTFTGIDP